MQAVTWSLIFPAWNTAPSSVCVSVTGSTGLNLNHSAITHSIQGLMKRDEYIWRLGSGDREQPLLPIELSGVAWHPLISYQHGWLGSTCLLLGQKYTGWLGSVRLLLAQWHIGWLG